MADLRPYSVTLHSQENDQFKRVNLLAEDADHAAALCEERERATVGYQLDDEQLEAANEIALYLPKDKDVDGRFYRAGRIVRTRSEFPQSRYRRVIGGVDNSGDDALVRSPAIGQRETSALRAMFARHVQEKPYTIGRVGAADEQMVLASMFGLQWQDQIEGGTNRFVWSSAAFKMSLHTSSYTPNVDTHDFHDDASTNEVTGTGYTAGGATLGSKTSTYDTASDQVRLDCADVSWTTSTITARHAVIYVDNGGAASADPVFGFINFESDVSTTAGTLQVTLDATGLFIVDVT